MFFTVIRCTLTVLVLLAAARMASAAEYLIICSGQSNMAGVAKSADMPAETKPIPKNVIFYLQPDPAKLTPQKSFADTPKYGPVPSFAHALSAARPDDTFVILQDAVGGTAIAQWVPDYAPKELAKNFKIGALYHAMIPRIAAIKKAHPNAKPLAFLWLQGESDKNAFAKVYGENLARLAANIRRDAGDPNLLVIVAEPGLADDAVHNALHAFAKGDKHAGIIASKELAPGQLHFNAKGYAEIGKRFATELTAKMPKR